MLLALAPTPCLAWNMLYEERRLIWGCEADILSMITKYILHNSLDMPIMMTNLYPFLMGQAALAHAIAVDIHPVCNLQVVAYAAEITGGKDGVREDWMHRFIRPGLLAFETMLAGFQQAPFCFLIGIAQVDTHQKAVEL